MHLSQRNGHESGRDYALRIIKDNIIRLELEPGSMVSENELASEMGVSRTPVREALIELNKVKIVEIYPQRGSSIALVDFALVEEAQFMRETLEFAVLERCCERGLTEEQSMRLQENLKLQDFHSRNRSMKLFELDNDFHKILFSAANLENVYMLMDSMTIHLDRVRTMHLIAAKDLSSVEEHHMIYNALMQRDAKTALEKMKGHIGHYLLDKKILLERYPQFLKQ